MIVLFLVRGDFFCYVVRPKVIGEYDGVRDLARGFTSLPALLVKGL